MGYDAVVDSAKLNGALTATAEAIRRKTDSTEPITFDAYDGFKSAVDGIEIGGDAEAAYNEGVEAGRQAEYDVVWDATQQDGTIYLNRVGLFAGRGWIDERFKPKYPLTIESNCNYMFHNSGIKNLKKIVDESSGRVLFGYITVAQQMFSYSTVESLPEIDFSRCNNIAQTFLSAKNMKSIEKIIVAETSVFSSTFEACEALTHVIFYGTIGKNGLNLRWSTLLDKESIASIINALSTNTSGLTVTLSKEAVNKAFETSAGDNDGSTSAEWLALAATKSNWTISLL